MFDPSDTPRVFQMPIGVDYAQSIVTGIEQRLSGAQPTDWGRVTIIVNTARMKRRLSALFDAGPARLVPQIKLISNVALTKGAKQVPPPVSKIKRRLELAKLIARLIEISPDLAPKSSIFDLADSLSKLIDEAHSESVNPADIQQIDVSDHSAHWARSQAFLALVQDYLGNESQPDAEFRQRIIVDAMIADWAQTPPKHPIILAGSTGSRGTTAALMAAVAKLPQGAVIVPGFDAHLNKSVWAGLDTEDTAVEDHPQYRLKAFFDVLDLQPDAIPPWSDDAPSSPSRNALVSLSLRPAPTTDQWMQEGPAMGDLRDACADMALIEAPSLRGEAVALAVLIRKLISQGKSVAMIAPDKTISRRVAAALDRWRILPDDSAGTPLPLTATGRYLLQISELMGAKLTSDGLLALLKNPMVFQGDDRGNHLRWTRDLELRIRKKGLPFPTGQDIIDWASALKDEGVSDWAAHIAKALDALADIKDAPLEAMVEGHIQWALHLIGADGDSASSVLWGHREGQKARQVVAMLEADAAHGGVFDCRDYQAFIRQLFSGEEVRGIALPRTDVMIWGTLEARIGGTDAVILSGLNEGSWPSAPAPDPWLNRKMRADVGLLSPDRKIGLSAHDYQIAMGAPEVWLSRSVRSSDAETVPSRWLNRLLNLISGLSDNHGPEALKQMRKKGQHYVELARALEAPEEQVSAASRPAPRPPLDARPRKLSVTRFKTLARNPYDIYAREVLRLRPLDPLKQSPDAPLRGVLMHSVMERFIREAPENGETDSDFLIRLATEEITQNAPWPATQRIWLAKFEKIIGRFLQMEAERRKHALPHPSRVEVAGELYSSDIDFTLTAKADRIDLDDVGQAVLYDYKTGTPPTKKQQKEFDRQLFLQVMMLEKGAFKDLAKMKVKAAEFLGLGTKVPVVAAPLDEDWAQDIEGDFKALIRAYDSVKQGYVARLAMEKDTDPSDYDLLSRFGEWDATQPSVPEDLT